MTPDPAHPSSELGFGYFQHHILICRGPDCCSSAQGDALWQYLKRRLKELNLVGAQGVVYRSKVECLQVCQNGPIVLIYPEGTWYHQVDEAKMERILQSHILNGKPLVAEAFAHHPLPFIPPSNLLL